MSNQLILNNTGYYTLDQSGWVYLPFVCEQGEQVIFTTAHSNFFKNQNWSVRFWISFTPRGEAINQQPQPSKAFVNPLKLPVNFGVYDLTFFLRPPLQNAIWLSPASPGLTYYLNVQNLENRPNGFFFTKTHSPIE